MGPPEARAKRLSTLEGAMTERAPLPVDQPVAEHFAALVSRLRAASRSPRVIDTLIAATALAHDATVVTQDDDFDDLGVRVLKV